MRRKRKEAIIQAAKQYLSSFPECDWEYDIIDDEERGPVLLVSHREKKASVEFLLARRDGRCIDCTWHFSPELPAMDQMFNDIAATEWILSDPDFIS